MYLTCLIYHHNYAALSGDAVVSRLTKSAIGFGFVSFESAEIAKQLVDNHYVQVKGRKVKTRDSCKAPIHLLPSALPTPPSARSFINFSDSLFKSND